MLRKRSPSRLEAGPFLEDLIGAGSKFGMDEPRKRIVSESILRSPTEAKKFSEPKTPEIK